MKWSWADVWPGTRVITLVLDEFEAEQLIDQAREEGRLVGRDVIRGMPAIAFGDPSPAGGQMRAFDDGAPPLRRPDDPADLDAWHGLGRSIEAETVGKPPAAAARVPPEPVAGEPSRLAPSQPEAAKGGSWAPSKPSVEPAGQKIIIFPGIRRERLPEPPAVKPAPLRQGDRPVLPAEPKEDNPPAAIKAVDPATRAMIDEAVNAGRVTKCPPRTFAIDANDPAGVTWKRVGPTGKTAKVAAARAKAKSRQEAGE